MIPTPAAPLRRLSRAAPRFCAAAALAVALGGCALTRPPSLACPALPLVPMAATVSSQSAPAPRPAAPAPRPDMGAMIEAETAEAVARSMRAEARATPPARPIVVNVVTLSAGGQWGAFGAGFLEGWSANPRTPRPRFDVVTGVSAGAILAPVAFAGPEFDPILRFYRGLSAEGVSRARALPALLAAPSIRTAAPLRRFLSGALSPALVAAIGARHAAGDQLLIGATNIDTTEAAIFDLGAVAEAGAPNAADCMVEGMLASAAIPGVLPPRHINGALYADGGLREQVFFRAVDTARARVARETGRPVRVEAYLIVNGALRAPEGPAPDRLLGYIARSVEVLADEVLRDSILDAVAFAEARPGWRLRGMVAEVAFPDCTFDALPTGTFDPCITRTLYDAGLAAGRAVPIDWKDARALRAIAEEL